MARQDVFFAGVPGAVRLHDCEGLLPALDAFFRLWPHAPQPAGLPTISGMLPSGLHETAPLLVITPQGRGYRLRSPWLPAPRYEPSRACLLCSLAIELVAACCHACPRLISLHAAAVCLHGRTLVFCGDNRAGKSTLVARLMAGAARGLGDDLLGLHRGKIFSFGVAPRLRLPPPSSPALKRFMNERPGIRDRHSGSLPGRSGALGRTTPRPGCRDPAGTHARQPGRSSPRPCRHRHGQRAGPFPDPRWRCTGGPQAGLATAGCPAASSAMMTWMKPQNSSHGRRPYCPRLRPCPRIFLPCRILLPLVLVPQPAGLPQPSPSATRGTAGHCGSSARA